jgi:hypothetical protein
MTTYNHNFIIFQVVVHELDAYSPLMPPPFWHPHERGVRNSSSAPNGVGNISASQYQNYTQPGAARSETIENVQPVRWRPPAYNHIAQHYGNKHDSRYYYEPGLLSRFHFPNQTRRSSDEYRNAINATTSLHPFNQSMSGNLSGRSRESSGSVDPPPTERSGHVDMSSEVPLDGDASTYVADDIKPDSAPGN